jgi:acetoacetate decarboxylase
MPVHAEAYPPPPYRLGTIQGANFICRIGQDAIRSLVPPVLEPNAEAHVWFYVVDMRIVEPVSVRYHEVGIFVPVGHDKSSGFFCVALYLD